MGITENSVAKYAAENLTEEQAQVVNQSLSGYISGLLDKEEEWINSECYIDDTEGLGDTGKMNTYYGIRMNTSIISQRMQEQPEEELAKVNAKLTGVYDYKQHTGSIKNLMKNYDKDGNYIDPTTGLTGLLITDENAENRKRIISIPESSKDEMFELTKKEFLRKNGIQNGDTTRRPDVYTNLHRKIKKNDRLAAGYTMEKYERAYRQAFWMLQGKQTLIGKLESLLNREL